MRVKTTVLLNARYAVKMNGDKASGEIGHSVTARLIEFEHDGTPSSYAYEYSEHMVALREYMIVNIESTLKENRIPSSRSNNGSLVVLGCTGDWDFIDTVRTWDELIDEDD